MQWSIGQGAITVGATGSGIFSLLDAFDAKLSVADQLGIGTALSFFGFLLVQNLQERRVSSSHQFSSRKREDLSREIIETNRALLKPTHEYMRIDNGKYTGEEIAFSVKNRKGLDLETWQEKNPDGRLFIAPLIDPVRTNIMAINGLRMNISGLNLVLVDEMSVSHKPFYVFRGRRSFYVQGYKEFNETIEYYEQASLLDYQSK